MRYISEKNNSASIWVYIQKNRHKIFKTVVPKWWYRYCGKTEQLVSLSKKLIVLTMTWTNLILTLENGCYCRKQITTRQLLNGIPKYHDMRWFLAKMTWNMFTLSHHERIYKEHWCQKCHQIMHSIKMHTTDLLLLQHKRFCYNMIRWWFLELANPNWDMQSTELEKMGEQTQRWWACTRPRQLRWQV